MPFMRKHMNYWPLFFVIAFLCFANTFLDNAWISDSNSSVPTSSQTKLTRGAYNVPGEPTETVASLKKPTGSVAEPKDIRNDSISTPSAPVAFNLGGPNGNLTFPQFLKQRNVERATEELWQKWLEGSPRRNPEQPLVLKLVMMTKDEWPLIKQWTLYHGELLGFQHLYIIDGSTDTQCIEFLTWARDEMGANVIFSDANLEELTGELTKIGQQIQATSDMSIKMDTDEFLTALGPTTGTPGATCTGSNNELNNPSCSLSPYAVADFLKDVSNFQSIADGRRLRVGYRQESIPNRDLCDQGRGYDLGNFGFTAAQPALAWKAVMDSRTFEGYDLGGHKNKLITPHGEKEDRHTSLGMLHFHNRCIADEIANCRKAVVSHGFIAATDDKEQALKKLEHYTGGPDNFCIPASSAGCKRFKVRPKASCHKVACLTSALTCPAQLEKDYYRGSNNNVTSNPDFAQFLAKAMEKYELLLASS